jgi:lipoprotein-releasing system ATP-binding protein
MTRVADKPADRAAAKGRDLSDAVLRVEKVQKSFVMGDAVVQVLENVDLLVRRGEFVAIEGRSGSGKSTLLHILGGLDSAQSGLVEFDGENIGELARKASAETAQFKTQAAAGWGLAPVVGLANFVLSVWYLIYFTMKLAFDLRADKRLAYLRNTRFGFVFQFYHLLPELNVLENTMLGAMIENSSVGFKAKETQLRDKARALLAELGLGHRMTHRPSQLSGGERQRVAIARALMNDPKILFADEPTGNLDAETGQQIMGVFERMHRERGQTIVMVTHDRTLARRADRILVLKDGKLSAPAPVNEPGI